MSVGRSLNLLTEDKKFNIKGTELKQDNKEILRQITYV